jgi:hypothetical protein
MPEPVTYVQLHAEIERERQYRIQEHQREVAERGLRAPLVERPHGPLNLFADGDSWFDYPLYYDTINWLKTDGSPHPIILNLAHYGDAAETLLGLTKRKHLLDALYNPANGHFDALLFSMGGNDIAGDQFVLWVLQYVKGTDPTHGIDRQRLSNILGIIVAAYTDLIEIRNAYNPDCVIFVHGYDFAQPTGRGVCGLGPWLKPSLDFRGWSDFALAAGFVREVLLAFDKLLSQLEQQNKNFVYVRTQDTLSPNSDWDNELHPTSAGFRKIAAVILGKIRARFPGKI